MDESRIRIVRLNAMLTGITTGLVAGLGVFVATNWLLVKGGRPVGPHLALLSQFFLGYRVTFAGSLIGFAWAFGCGFAGGYFVSRVYNLLALRRERA
ncbi:MAG TPA: hypothetical protein VEM57_08210 [Candidatus Binatus sp.]|nr:hypothetical protein [Candidatus Binatus sp.]